MLYKRFTSLIKVYTLLIIIGDYTVANAQWRPNFNQYQLNNYLINPAVTGIENYTDLKAGFRKQWEGIPGAPVTQYITLHAPLGKTDNRITPTSFFVKGENTYGIPAIERSTSGSTHHGVGLMAMSDKAGFLSRWALSASYAFHTPISTYTMLSVGFSAGLTGVSADRTKMVFAGLDPDDPAIGFSYDELNKRRFEMGAGIWLYNAEFYLGLSALNITAGKYQLGKEGGVPFTPNYMATAGGRMLLSEKISFLPSVMYQRCEPGLSGYQFTGKLQYVDLVWAGLNYRYSSLISGYTALAGLNVSNTFNISYAYEMSSNSELQKYTRSTHELTLGLIFGNNYGNLFNRDQY
jgi:type IX secretion system PorP/SprF family membrane protein